MHEVVPFLNLDSTTLTCYVAIFQIDIPDTNKFNFHFELSSCWALLSIRRTQGNAIEIPHMRKHISDEPRRIPLLLGQTLILHDIFHTRCCTNPRRYVILRTDVYIAHGLERHTRHRIISVSETVIVTFCGSLVGDVLRCCYIADARLAECSLDFVVSSVDGQKRE